MSKFGNDIAPEFIRAMVAKSTKDDNWYLIMKVKGVSTTRIQRVDFDPDTEILSYYQGDIEVMEIYDGLPEAHHYRPDLARALWAFWVDDLTELDFPNSSLHFPNT